MFRRLLVVLLLSSPVFAAPFVISDPQITSTRSALREISLGGCGEGFLISGLLSHSPGILPVGNDGEPRTLGGGTRLDVPSANSAGEPVFAGGRWIVPITPDFLAPERVFLAQVKPDGSPAGETKMIPSQGAKGFALAWNGTNLLLAIAREHDFTTYDVVVRTLSADLSQVGEEHAVASGVTTLRLRAVGQEFVTAYQSPFGLASVVLGPDGSAAAPPVVLSTSPQIGSVDVVNFGGKPAVTWAEAATTGWSYRIATLDAPGEAREIARISDERIRAFARATDEGVVVAWNGVYYDGNLRGHEITWGILGASGAWVSAPETIEGPGVLQGAASNGHEALLVWDRHFDGVGTPMWGALVAAQQTPVARFMGVDYARPSTLAVSGSADGTTHAAWIEGSGTGEEILTASFDRDGTRIGAIQRVRSKEGTFDDIAIASNGTDTLLVWGDGGALWGAYLNRDATIAGESFIWNYGGGAPTVAAIADGFLVAWIGAEGVEARTINGSVISSPKTVAVPPPHTPNSTFGIRRVRLAATIGGAVAAMDVPEWFFCTGIPCPETSHVGYARVSMASDPQTITLLGEGAGVTVASDGYDLLLAWTTMDGIRLRLMREGEPDRDSILHGNGSPELVWNGAGYTLAWSEGSQYANRIAVGSLTRDGEVAGPMRQASVERTGFFFRLAATGGDVLVAWLDRIDEPLGMASAPMGQFLSDMELAQPLRRRALGR